MRLAFRNLLRAQSGSVAPVVALSLFGLIAAGGIAFDYARLASMDTELQNAADQAALAAASQLDGEAGACERAAAAAANLLTNSTLFANGANSSNAVLIPASSGEDCAGNDFIQFYQSYDQTADTFGPAATGFADANVVRVSVQPREAFYALTPIVGAISSGPIPASAVAALGSAMCKVPPVMMCNPAEPSGNTDPNYDFNPARGDGLRLVIDAPDAPGNFGFLRLDEAGAKEVAMQLGYDNPPHGCISSEGGVETQPGDMQAVRAAFNTRFDIYEKGNMTCPGGGVCSPSVNSRKDLVRSTGCGLTTNTSKEDWHEALIPYRAPNTTPLSGANPMNASHDYPEMMGFPRDLCHAVSISGACAPVTGNAIVGNGDWDIDAYFWVNYEWSRSDWMAQTQLALDASEVPNVTRYDVYIWEMKNAGVVPAEAKEQLVSGGFTAHAAPVCQGPGIDPTTTPPSQDRRRVSVAVVNCEAQGVGGHKKAVTVRKWLDVFLVEPAVARPDRTTNGDIYVEVIEVASTGGSTNNLPTRRDVPYLIR